MRFVAMPVPALFPGQSDATRRDPACAIVSFYRRCRCARRAVRATPPRKLGVGSRASRWRGRSRHVPDAPSCLSLPVANDIAFLVSFGTLPVRACSLLPGIQHRRSMFVAVNVPFTLHRSVNDVVEILPRMVVRRYDERRVRVLRARRR